MNRVLVRSVIVTLPVMAALTLVGAAPASAHERRTVGAFEFVVGWGDEPCYTGFKNSVQFSVTEASGAAAVTDLGDSLNVEVIKGSEKMTVPLVPNFRVGAFGTPGDYRAWVTPTRPGAYTFRFSGSIRGQSVDESFSSSKTTFNDVEDGANIEFPVKDPSTGQLATRIDREVPRLETRLREAEDRADGARALALVGALVGAVGLLGGAGALVVARRRGVRRDGAGAEGSEALPEQSGSLSR